VGEFSLWLVDWDRRTVERCFDLKTGLEMKVSPRSRPQGERRKDLCGYAARCKGGYALAYRSRDGLWLQFRDRRYRLDDGSVSFSHSPALRGVLSSLHVQNDAATTTIRSVSAARLWVPLLDPAHDELDAEQEDFLRWIARHANDERWVKWIVERWKTIEAQGGA